MKPNNVVSPYEETYKRVLDLAVSMFWEEDADSYTADIIMFDPRWEKYTAKYRKKLRGLRDTRLELNGGE